MEKENPKRKRKKNFFLITTIAFTIFLSTICFSAGAEEKKFYEPKEKVPLWKELFEGIADPVIYFVGEFIQRVIFVYNAIIKDIREIGKLVYDNFELYLLKNPDLSRGELLLLINYFISILEPLYVAAIISVGIYLTFISSSPIGRAKAKSYLLRLILSMILISISVPIIKVLFEISHGLTQGIFSLGPPNLIQIHKNSIFYSIDKIQEVSVINIPTGIPFILFSLLIAVGIFLVLIARYFLVLFLSILFPLAVFLYSFSLTKNIGKLLLQQLFFWVFLPVAFAVALVSISLGENLFHSLLAELWIFDIAGTLALILSPIGMFYATKAIIKVSEKLAKSFTEIEEKIIPELKEVERVKLTEKEVEVSLKEMSNLRGEINEEDIEKNEKLYRQLRREAREKGISFEEYIKEKYGFKIVKGEGVYEEAYEEKVVVERIPTKVVIPKERRIIERRKFVIIKKVDEEIKVNLGPRAKPMEGELRIEKGEKGVLEINIENLTALILHEITLSDQDFAENDIFFKYSENKFSLSPGETKKIYVTVTVMEDVKTKIYTGEIIITCREGFKNFIDVKIHVLPKKVIISKTIREVEATLKGMSIEGKITMKKLEENELLYEQLKNEAEEEGKSLKEYVEEKYEFKIVSKEKEEEKKPLITEEAMKIKPFVVREAEEEVVKEEKVKEEKEKVIVLAPPAPEAKPKITKLIISS